MTNKITSDKKASKIILLLSIAVFIFWLPGKSIDVYHFAFVGVIFEILWLPIIAMTFVLPIMSFVFWRKEKFNLRSRGFYSIVVLVMTILMAVFYK